MDKLRMFKKLSELSVTMTYMLKDLPHTADEGFLVDRVQSLQGGGVALVLHYGQLLYISTKNRYST
jgi:hypothetical protein